MLNLPSNMRFIAMFIAATIAKKKEYLRWRFYVHGYGCIGAIITTPSVVQCSDPLFRSS